MALMVFGAVRLRTWARPERARGVHGHVAARRGKAGWDRSRSGKSWRGAERCGAVCHGREARMVVGQVRFLARARPERAHVAARRGSARSGTVSRGTAGQVAAGLVSARLGMARHGWSLGWSQEGFDSPPEHGPQGLAVCTGTAGLGTAPQGRTWEGALLADTGVQVPGAHDLERGSRRGRHWRG